MRVFLAFWLLLCGAFTIAVGEQNDGGSLQRYDTTVTTCEDLHSNITGTVLVVAPVICKEQKVKLHNLTRESIQIFRFEWRSLYSMCEACLTEVDEISLRGGYPALCRLVVLG